MILDECIEIKCCNTKLKKASSPVLDIVTHFIWTQEGLIEATDESPKEMVGRYERQLSDKERVVLLWILLCYDL
jgi:hypothetical protein